MQYDVIIIGAGHNGLTAAAYLARWGRRVLVLERRDVVGGCAVTEEVDPTASMLASEGIELEIGVGLCAEIKIKLIQTLRIVCEVNFRKDCYC